MTRLGKPHDVRNLVRIARILRKLVADLDRRVPVDRVELEHHVQRAALARCIRGARKVVREVRAYAEAREDAHLLGKCLELEAPIDIEACVSQKTYRRKR